MVGPHRKQEDSNSKGMRRKKRGSLPSKQQTGEISLFKRKGKEPPAKKEGKKESESGFAQRGINFNGIKKKRIK